MPETYPGSMSLVDMVLPDQCNHHGTLFGGAALAMLDKLAFILGSKVLRGPLVTAAVRQLEFRVPPSAPPEPDTVCVAEIVFPGHANHRGILHGGPAMAWLAKAGFAAATRRARLPVVMAGSDRLDFLAPARVGEVVEIVARVAQTGRSSLTVHARMDAESPESGERRCCTTASLVFVAIDATGKSMPLRAGGGHE